MTIQNDEVIRQHTVTLLSDGIINALTNINGGSTHLNLRDWIYWKGNLNLKEHEMLYDAIIKGALEVYARNGTTEKSIRELLPQ